VKILVAAPYYEPARGFGGPVQSIGALVAAMNSAGTETVVLSTDADGVRARCVPEPGWKICGGVKVHYSRCWGFSKPSPVGRFFFSPALARKLVRILPDSDLLHLQGTFVFPTLAGSRIAWMLDKPYVVSARGALFPWGLGHKSFKKRLYLSLLERKSLQRAARVHCTSELEARLAKEAFPGLPTAVIPNPVESESAEGMTFRNRLGIGNASPLVVFLGRIHPIKGLELLVEVASRVIREMPGTIFALVGNDEGGHATEIRDLISRRGLERAVILPGPVRGSEKWAALAAADVFVLTSHQENFGMSAAEAMSCGVPVVTSAAVGIAEDITSAGAGLVVERTPERFSGAVISLLRDADIRRSMGEAGRNAVARNYIPEVVARSMLRMYGEIIEEYGRRPVSWKARVCRSAFGSLQRANP
jgi:glycosyltransferase involved in cell wall biosynthesis